MKILIHTLGCRLNQAESESIALDLVEAGFKVTQNGDFGDIVILNTCSVTELAQKKSQRKIQYFRKKNPQSLLIVVGCAVDYNQADLKRLGADFLLPNSEKDKLPRLIKESQLIAPKTAGIFKIPKYRTRALVKIQDGCNNFCTYCIIPYLRDRLRSRKIQEVIDEIREKEKQGFREVVLTGVNIGKYHSRAKGKVLNLAGLLREILAHSNISRIRLSSINPEDVDDDLIEVLRESRICSHLHLSLQSGSLTVLRRMRRAYTPTQYYRLYQKLKKVIPEIALTTDLIVGFPGETPAEFQETLAFLEKIDFLKIHIFRFSPKKGTEASKMPGQVPQRVKSERMEKISLLAERLGDRFLSRFQGKSMRVLFEQKKNGFWLGLTDNYIKVYAKSRRNIQNKIKKVVLNQRFQEGFEGVLK